MMHTSARSSSESEGQATERPTEWMLRLLWITAGIASVGLAAASPGTPVGMLATIAAYGCLVSCVRGLSARQATAWGLLVGMAASLLFWAASGVGLHGGVAFCAIAMLTAGGLGYLVGERPTAAIQAGPEASRGAFGEILEDYREWLTAGSPCWASFDLFVRSSAREHLGAEGVRCFHVLPDGSLQPLTRTVAPQQPSVFDGDPQLTESAATGAAFWASTAGDPGLGPTDKTRKARWDVILPISNGEFVVGLIAARRCPARSLEASGGQHVHNLFSVCWTHARDRLELQRRVHTDWQSGVLNRGEFLIQLDEAVQDRGNEPLALVALGIEGLRGLDQAGYWSVRDALIENVGRLMRGRLRADDLIGRFTDERFLILLRGLHAPLAIRVARHMVKTVNAEAVRMNLVLCEIADGPLQPGDIAVRVGLAFRPPEGETGGSLLERGLHLLDEARDQGVEMLVQPTCASVSPHKPAPAEPVRSEAAEVRA